MFTKPYEVPNSLVMAQTFQKAHDYSLSRKLYKDFFDNNPHHPLRFKALFEVADNLFYEKKYTEALKAYEDFISYCKAVDKPSLKDLGWINAYTALAHSRIKNISKAIQGRSKAEVAVYR